MRAFEGCMLDIEPIQKLEVRPGMLQYTVARTCNVSWAMALGRLSW
jgi:hypothetical protein